MDRMYTAGRASTTTVSVLLSFIVIGLLFMAGPADAITVSIGTPSDSTPTRGDTVTIDLDIDIEETVTGGADEIVPLNNISIYVTGPGGPYECFFDRNGVFLSGVSFCDDLTLVRNSGALTTSYGYNRAEGYTTGGSEELVRFGYGYDYGYGYGYEYGYGYGYNPSVTPEFAYTLSWNTSDASSGSSYYFNARAYAAIDEDAAVFTSATSRSVRVGSSGGGGGGGGGSRSSDTPITDLRRNNTFTGWLVIGAGGTPFWTFDGVHFISLLNITGGGALFEIRSTPQQAFLLPGETAQVDVNADGKSDVALSLVSVDTNKVHIEIEPGSGTPSTLRAAPSTAAATTDAEDVPEAEPAKAESTPPAVTGDAVADTNTSPTPSAVGASMAGMVFVVLIVVLLGVGAYLLLRKK